MKKFMIWIAVVGITTSCSQLVNFSGDYTPLSFEQEIEKFDLIKYNNSIRLNGDIKAWVSCNGDLNIYTETEDVKHIFFVQNLQNFEKSEFDIEELIYLNGGLYFVKGQKEFFLGALDNSYSNSIRDDVKSVFGEEISDFYGSGVGYSRILKNDELSNIINLTKLKEASSVLDFLKGDEVKGRIGNGNSGVQGPHLAQ